MASELKKYSIIDIETTGGSARANKVIEIALINMDGDEVVETFNSLIFPERGIPPQIQYITGITDEMVEDAPKFYELAKKIVELTEGRVFVAHNVHFDYSFVKNEFKELGYQFKRELLCTVRLARKILPGFASYSLGKLCADLNIPLKNRHRAMGDAEATAILFQKILNKNNRGFEEIFNKLNEKINFPPYFNEADYENLPSAPGIYYLWDKQGKLLYVGKAKKLKQRVRQHFDVKSGRSKEMEFKNSIANISFQETGNELAALLLEAHEIKTRSPFFNRALRRKHFPWAVAPSMDKNGFLEFKGTKESADEHPIRCGSRKKADSIIRKIYQGAFGVDPELELRREQELSLLQKTLGPEKYNARLTRKYESLTYPQESFQIKLQGRCRSEICFIKRFGNKDLHIVYEKMGEENERFRLEENPDLTQITLQYLRKKEIKTLPMED